MVKNKLSIEDINSKVGDQIFWNNGKTTICILTLQNGFEVVGTSGCVDPANFDQAIGEKIAYEKALDQVWLLEGYLLQDSLGKE